MHTTGWLRAARAMRWTAATALSAALSAACAAESALAPRDAAVSGRRAALGACEQLRAPEGSVLAAHLYARGVQIYRWDGARWLFDGPSAALYADARFTGQVGTHFAGPTWVHAGGGTVRGSSPVACTVAPDAIPWLLLRATPDAVAGVFNRVTAIQRLHTVGGTMPGGPGAAPGEVRRVPYTAEYFFYR